VLAPRPDSRFKDSRQPKYNRYTPLVSNRVRILEEALNADLITIPQRVPTPPNADTTKHCQYHQNYGHTMEDCFALKDKIEELIQAGHLRRFVKREEGGFSSKEERKGRYEERPQRTSRYQEMREEGTRRRVEPEEDDEQDVREKPLRGVINYISGGFAGGGATTSARKKYVRAIQSVNAVTVCPRRHMPPITFRDDDFQAIDPQHDDPMVISVEIKDFTVRKTLVDPGSSVDILYWGTFRKLRILEGKIQQYSEPIVGFSGERVNTKGYIELFTKFGAGRTTRTVKIRYLIVDADTSYNILLGRPSLNILGAVISTYHLAIKFPSTSGDIVTVHVDQPTACRCYADSLRKRPLDQVESPTPLQYQNQTQVFSPGKSSVANGKCCPETRGEVLSQLGIGPLRVKEVVGKYAYRWKHLSGVSVPTTWNASHLKYYN